MNVTTTIDGTSARISAHGEIDFDTLPPLRAAAASLPPQVTDLQWDLTHVPFMDVAGLHLLFDSTTSGLDCRTAVSGLGSQPLRLLHTAAGVNPAVFDLSRLLPDTAGQPSTSRPALQPCP
ncbi:STAS domain-containing protein [Streptomyces capillispiralis]|uniref:STAS domain-containing protein n=1 Tax=Streptomyces capillispiralis TaxID=68182 RepID=UPI0036BF62D0